MTPLVWTIIAAVIVVTTLAPIALVLIVRRADRARLARRDRDAMR